MGFHLKHGPPVTVHRVLGLFSLAAPPLPSAGDDATCSLQRGLVQEVVQGQGTTRLARALTMPPPGLGVPVPRPPLGPSCALQCSPQGCAQRLGPCAAVHMPTPRSALAPGMPAHGTATAPKRLGSVGSPSCFARTICIWEARGRRRTATLMPLSATRVHCCWRAGQQENLVHVQDQEAILSSPVQK